MREWAVHKTMQKKFVMDDEPTICAFLSKVLTKMGYIPELAADGLAAIRVSAECSIENQRIRRGRSFIQPGEWKQLRDGVCKLAQLPGVGDGSRISG